MDNTLTLAAPAVDGLEEAFEAPAAIRPHSTRGLSRMRGPKRWLVIIAIVLVPTMAVSTVTEGCALAEGSTWVATLGWSAVYITVTPHTWSIASSAAFGAYACNWVYNCVIGQWLQAINEGCSAPNPPCDDNVNAFRNLVINYIPSLVSTMQTIFNWPGMSINAPGGGQPSICIQGWIDLFGGPSGWEPIRVTQGECR